MQCAICFEVYDICNKYTDEVVLLQVNSQGVVTAKTKEVCEYCNTHESFLFVAPDGSIKINNHKRFFLSTASIEADEKGGCDGW